MNIILSTGRGTGPTARAAYDAALISAGVTHYNMIGLSSVIPPHSRIYREKYLTPADDYGKRLYVVTSQMNQERSGQWAHAALGWLQEEKTGRGLFIELHGADLARLQKDLRATADAMRRCRQIPYGPMQSEIVSIPCRQQPVWALAIAIYTRKF
jgi:arginine decarboxylase